MMVYTNTVIYGECLFIFIFCISGATDHAVSL